MQSDGKRKRCIHDLVSLFSRFGFFCYFSNTLLTILSLEVYVELLCPPTGFWGGDMEAPCFMPPLAEQACWLFLCLAEDAQRKAWPDGRAVAAKEGKQLAVETKRGRRGDILLSLEGKQYDDVQWL